MIPRIYIRSVPLKHGRNVAETDCNIASFMQYLSRERGMPRKKRQRAVQRIPTVPIYKPAGVPAKELEEIFITVDEFEAIRLADFKGLNQREASKIMKISQPTFNRVLSSARSKIAMGIVQGLVLRFEGGRYVLTDTGVILECRECGSELSDVADDERCPECGSSQVRRVGQKSENR
jgi:predicted DNA-binding protein (UPF0251 family)